MPPRQPPVYLLPQWERVPARDAVDEEGPVPGENAPRREEILEARRERDRAEYLGYIRERGAARLREEARLAGLAMPNANANEEETGMAANVKPLNLDRWFGIVKNRIYRVGIEMEGGWLSIPDGGKAKIGHDGSVFRAGCPPGWPRLAATGEIASAPIEPALAASWMRKYHPSHIDESCGLHIHMGFKSALHYSRLMVPEYPATVLSYLQKWAKDEGVASSHCIWDRLAGKNKFCQDKFWPDLQAIKAGKEHNVEQEGKKKGNRYTVVNYCWGLGFETLEIRVLPMFEDPGLSVRAIKKCIDVTNAFLGATAKKEQKFKVEATQSDGEEVTREKRIVYV